MSSAPEPTPPSNGDRSTLEFHTTEELLAELAARSDHLVVLQVAKSRQNGWRLFQRGSQIWALGAMRIAATDFLADQSSAIAPDPDDHPRDLSEGGGS